MNDVRYQEALDYLYSFVDYSRERSDRYSPEAFELDRTRRFLSHLGNPHELYPSIHVAGTKGKGSVAAIVASCLSQAGLRTGLYTSPHLVDFTERIQIDGLRISGDRLADLVKEIKPIVALEPEITTYELMTVLAFLHFAREEVDIAVLEVGLGGRLDSTNVVTPLVSVITSISYDHTHLLGDSLEEIAREKAGIIKPGIPVVIAPQRPAVRAVLRDIALDRGSRMVEADRSWRVEIASAGLEGQRIRIQPKAADGDGRAAPESVELWLPLLGRHQVENAVVAYATLHTAVGLGLPVGEAAIRRGFRQVRWLGRFQLLSLEPVLVVDAAHNADSAQRLRQALADYLPGRPVTLVFGASSDKDIKGMLAALVPASARIIFTQAVHPRAADPYELRALVPGEGPPAEVVVPVPTALERAVAATPANGVVLATGSLFVIGEVLAAWRPDRESLPAQPVGGEPA